MLNVKIFDTFKKDNIYFLQLYHGNFLFKFDSIDHNKQLLNGWYVYISPPSLLNRTHFICLHSLYYEKVKFYYIETAKFTKINTLAPMRNRNL
jgi:hypothetical protein